VFNSLTKPEYPVCQTRLSGFDSSNSTVSFVKFQNHLFTPPSSRRNHGTFRCFVQIHFTSFELWRYTMFNRLIDSTQVQLGRWSSSRSSGGSTCRRHTEQDIVNEKMEQQLRENEEYKLHSHAYFEQQGIPFPQVQLPPLAPLAPPHSWMHHTGHGGSHNSNDPPNA
jgi:hypothetical protein